jgi:GT2 family glycosyltransferase
MVDLSVIIVSFNVREYLKQCLLSVKKASGHIDCEIFVVDNNSEDDSIIMVRQQFPEVILIVNKVNRGFSAANNQAIKQAKGNFILLLNPDTIVGENTFSECIRFMKDHPDAGALGVRMVDGEGYFLRESKRSLPTPGVAFVKAFGLSTLFPHSQYFNRYYLSHIDSFKLSKTEVISGAYMLLRAEALKTAGLPDEIFFMYGEDIDLSYRILQSGYNNYYFPEVQIVHFKGKSTRRNNFTDIFHFYRAMRIYAGKRQSEKFSLIYFIIIPGILLREAISLGIRFFKILFRLLLRKP